MFVEALGGDLNGRLLGFLPIWAVYLVDLCYAMFVLINMMGCLWLFTAYSEGVHNLNWLCDVGECPPLQHDAQCFECMCNFCRAWKSIDPP